MATDANDYLFDNKAKQAGDRFGALASLFDPVTFRHLDELGISAGQRCWEVGAGGGTVARWMADRVGPSGFVLATDLDVQWLEHDLRVPNVKILRHDVLRDATLSDEFDLVHERPVLLHITDRPLRSREWRPHCAPVAGCCSRTSTPISAMAATLTPHRM